LEVDKNKIRGVELVVLVVLPFLWGFVDDGFDDGNLEEMND
jgi:hypothetical protein